MRKHLLSTFVLCMVNTAMIAQNPIIRDQYAADPTARVFNNKVYLYPSHDIIPPAGQRPDWFCMADYHVFSSSNLTDWTDHGVIVSQELVPWGKKDGYSIIVICCSVFVDLCICICSRGKRGDKLQTIHVFRRK